MARPQKDVVNYFPHDANASAGDTLTVLQSRFGNDGYAFWFKLLEKLASSEGHYVDCRNPTKWQLLLAKTGVDELTGVEIMKLLVEMQAIDKDLWKSKLIWCQKLVDNISDVYKNRRREIPQKPIITSLKAIIISEKAITTGKSTQSKVKESKVNKTIYIPYPEFPNVNKMTQEEHQKLIDMFGEAGAKDRVENLSLYIASRGDKYKNHYATILAWEKRDKREKPYREMKKEGKPKEYWWCPECHYALEKCKVTARMDLCPVCWKKGKGKDVKMVVKTEREMKGE